MIRIAGVVALIIISPVSARADGTVLLGLMTLDGPRPSIGVAVGYSPSVAGFEVEYPDYRLILLGDPQGASGVPSTKRPQRFAAGLHFVF